MQHATVRPAATPAAEIHLGNIYLIAATVAIEVLREAGCATDQPAILTIDENGDMHAVGPEHPEYDERLVSPGFACTASPAMDTARMAQRIRAAAMAGEAAG